MKTSHVTKTIAMPLCALGALLFGGTRDAANAGVVGLPGRPSGGPSSWAYLLTDGYDMETNRRYQWNNSGNPTNASIQVAAAPGAGSFFLSQFTGDGFALKRYSPVDTSNTAVIDQYFQVYGNFRFTLTAELWQGTEVAISHFSANHEILADSIYLSSQGSVSLNGTLVDCGSSIGDYYLFHFSMSNRSGLGEGTLETLFNLSFHPNLSVPGPGAIALLGLAGGTPRRRRREG